MNESPFSEMWANEVFDYVSRGHERHQDMARTHREGWSGLARAVREGLGDIANAIRDRR